MKQAPQFLLLLALACSSSPDKPSEYHQGAFRPPPPPALRPGHGAPTYAPNALPGVLVEPQPRPTRFLPQTPETSRQPGIWASQDPDAEPAAIFDWNVPLPENDEEAAVQVKKCASAMKAASDVTIRPYDVESLDNANPDWRKCWPHAAVLHCLSKSKEELAHTAPSGRTYASVARATNHAKQAVSANCDAAPWRPHMEARLIAAWSAAKAMEAGQ